MEWYKSVTIKGKSYRPDTFGTLYLNTKGITDITEIEGLEHLTNLKKLVLNRNRIVEIKGLEKLKSLQILDLSKNEIEELKGLEHLTHLKSLSLSRNEIWKSDR